ncbi:MAG: CDP-alcohol phosphatidyltransferase family protein [Vampirovibrionales bacterium]|nr:CDP-alcohol phosphatidyltransferase family protein [Vampirovibrionales bacterium]
MLANWITALRTLMALLAIALLFTSSPGAYWAAFGLTVAAIWMDGLDGYVARARGETSTIGAQLDIFADRIVEQAYWLGFLALGWIPLWVPMTVMIRGVLVDGFRAIAQAQGYSAFGQSTMMQSPLGVLLVSSRFSRWTYAVTKALAFALMIVAHRPGVPAASLAPWQDAAWIMTLIAVIFCALRGLPVLVEGRRFLSAKTP